MTTAVLFAVPYADVQTVPPCLADHLHGVYGEHAIFKSTSDVCASQIDSDLVVPLPASNAQLVWLHEADIDVTLKTPAYDAEVAHFFQWLDADATSVGDQTVLAAPGSLLYHDHTRTSALVAVPDDVPAHALSTFLPRYWKASPIPHSPFKPIPVPQNAVDHVRKLLASSQFDPMVATIVDGLSLTGMRKDIRFLTNEDGTSGIESRSSFAHGSRVAANWLKKQFEHAGASCTLVHWDEDFAPNVVCKYAGTIDTESTVLLSAHYDSRGSFGLPRAPGANDDGSGTISLLAIARRIKELGLVFHTNVELVAFAGEEQGLLGSRAYARELRAQDANVTLMIQADMLAYHAPHEPLQLGLPKYIGTPEVSELIEKMAAMYSPELTVGYTGVCCSDHQSFHEQGFAASQVFERTGPIADPMYHNSRDLSDRPGYDLEQVWYISRVQFATLLHAAGFELP